MASKSDKLRELESLRFKDDQEKMQGETVGSQNRSRRKICRVIANILLAASAIAALSLLFTSWFYHSSNSPRTFTVDTEHNVFLKDGKPFRFISGSIHYFRIPRIYWLDRLMKAKAAGLDAVQIYVPWNFHEMNPGEYSFDDDKDVVEFLKLANSLDLLVLLRVGPYVCAEWDFGGLPGWLLAENPKMNLRSSAPEFLIPVIRWFEQLLPKIKPMLYQNGGPVIMVQLENEYGAYYTCDLQYLARLYEYARFILGDEIILYTTDMNTLRTLRCGSSDRRLFSTVDFGIDAAMKPDEAFKPLIEFQPHGPLVNSEYYTGWIDHWGEKKHRVDAEKLATGAANLLTMSESVSVNLYMFHGGTNFGYWNGANSPSEITITSYDYDAPLSEAGDTTYKYMVLRDLFYKIKNQEPPSIPPNISKASYGKASVDFYSHLIYDLHGGVHSAKPLHMEALKQYQGFMAYSHVLDGIEGSGRLGFDHAKDIGLVFATDPQAQSIIYLGTIFDEGVLNITFDKDHPVLTVVTENKGHINFGPTMMGDIKGIHGRVVLDGEELLDWFMKGLDFRTANPTYSNQSRASFPDAGAIYKGVFNVPSPPMDTFAVLTGFTRGVLAINGHIAGRYNPVAGPQVSLYVPANMLIPGENVISILELEKIAPACHEDISACYVTFTDSPVWLN
ncbi:hypothetical protein Aperf_G00000020155 [Anoplocephala perfoliata]